MILLYTYTDISKHDYFLSKYLKVCDDKMVERLSRFKNKEVIQQSLLGRALLDIALKELIGEYSIVYSEYNKPIIDYSGLFFNISHSKNIVACVLSNFDIGIDIEYINRDLCINDYTQVMTTSERSHIFKSFDKHQAFCNYWTQKESVLKAVGKGLSIDLSSFTVKNNETYVNDEVYYIRNFLLDNNYACHLASNHVYFKTCSYELLNIIL